MKTFIGSIKGMNYRKQLLKIRKTANWHNLV